MLKGYAGSGKTTILKGLIDYLEANERDVDVIAPTGRAAKVLKDKTLHGCTIHKGIYNFKELKLLKTDSIDVAEKSYHINFPILDRDGFRRVIIVDEASMVSNSKTEHELFTFGTGKLLNDLLTYAKIKTSQNKIIFVGDPAQLPPVTDPKSLALEESFFLEADIAVESTEMKEVHRQVKENPIQRNAIVFRELLATEKRSELNLEFDDDNFIHLSDELPATKYTELFPNPEIGNGVIICYSNAQALSYNQSIREKIFPGKYQTITVGDVLLINSNNYHAYGLELYNGDMATVVSVSPTVESMSAPVYVTEGKERIRKVVDLQFRNIVVRFPHHDQDVPCKIIESLLNSPLPSLSVTELKALYINFIIRFNEEQNDRKKSGLPYFREGSEEFKDKLKKDPYFNALRVKYGYAITCHKAQGSEWDTIFVDYRGQVGIRDAQLRWCYTALTRAKRVCYNIYPPSFGALDAINFDPITLLNSLGADAIHFLNVSVSPYHLPGSHPCKSAKYYEILEKVQDTPFQLRAVESKPYLEIYHFVHDEQDLRIQTNHDGAGIFGKFLLVKGDAIIGERLLSIVNLFKRIEVEVVYTPTTLPLSKLFTKISTACSELDVVISGVKEYQSSYYVLYIFQTKTGFASLQFYFDKNGKITKAQPKAFQGEPTDSLTFLISKLAAHAV